MSLHLVRAADVIGEPPDDVALSVKIEDLDRSVWIAPDLVEYLDHGSGTVMHVGDRQFTRTAEGEWQQAEADDD